MPLSMKENDSITWNKQCACHELGLLFFYYSTTSTSKLFAMQKSLLLIITVVHQVTDVLLNII